MLHFEPTDATTEPELVELIRKIEEKRNRRLFVFCQDIGSPGYDMDQMAVEHLKNALANEQHLGDITILLESPGGDIDCAYRMVRLLRHQADDMEVLVTRWAKSAATFFCLGANTIYMARDAELGPLDTQVADPKGSKYGRSSLQAFKSLEYLRQHVLEALDEVTQILSNRYGMDTPFALDAARPLISSLVGPLYAQLDPHELGEGRRYLAIGEEYSKIVMRRYSYPHLDPFQIERIVRRLVWDFPSHGFVLDLESIQELGLNAKLLDADTTKLCEELTRTVKLCIGMAPPPAEVQPRRRRARKEVIAQPAETSDTRAGTIEEGVGSNGKNPEDDRPTATSENVPVLAQD